MSFKRISVAQAKELIEEKPETQIIDIRDEESYERGHIESATHIYNSNVQTFLAEADMDQPLIVCCYHGNMSQSAAAYFAEQGFDESCSLDGGYEAWQEAEAQV